MAHITVPWWHLQLHITHGTSVHSSPYLLTVLPTSAFVIVVCQTVVKIKRWLILVFIDISLLATFVFTWLLDMTCLLLSISYSWSLYLLWLVCLPFLKLIHEDSLYTRVCICAAHIFYPRVVFQLCLWGWGDCLHSFKNLKHKMSFAKCLL